ncbi:glycosyltransferase [Kocuria coralli]|uniref:D-inositol 3-phosphate glycosyltransferase n=1 Tax=Kocuria coralli TaxID=1461025 RepID=A0A5J5KZG8_9MICC|nr:glycosyltransferase [Kocuria coralli]KAA9395157.1 glycosyltransferase [Kocuria coralli]
MTATEPGRPGSAPSLHIALLALHTSPLMQPGQGDAGGMNVYVRHLAEALTVLGHSVDLVTLWRSSEHPGERAPADPVTFSSLAPGLRLVTVSLPGTRAASKDGLARELPAIASALLDGYTREGAGRPDVVHGHYWLSLIVGRQLARAWAAPLVATFHTTARAKNARAGEGEAPEPAIREAGEQRVIDGAGAVVVNTTAEERALAELYGADTARVHVIPPGVDTTVFHPGSGSATERPFTIGFAGRLQALKGPDILVKALSLMRRGPDPVDARLWIAGVGSSGFTRDLEALIRSLSLTEAVETTGSVPVVELARRFRDSDVVAVPSSSETFGLVALEAQACGIPVVATAVDGLSAAVADGETGWLLADRRPETWAAALTRIARDPVERERRAGSASCRARGFSWQHTAEAHQRLYLQLRHPAP